MNTPLILIPGGGGGGGGGVFIILGFYTGSSTKISQVTASFLTSKLTDFPADPL